mgnify:CR=1 FL=1
MSMVMDIVRDGMATGKGRSIHVLGELLTDWLLLHKAEAEKTVEGKTLSGALQAIMETARKQGGSWGVVDDQEGLRIALGYFGVTPPGDTAPIGRATGNVPAIPDALDLDALLGG